MGNDFCHAAALIDFKGLSENTRPGVVCIFEGSSPGDDPAHIDASKSLNKVFRQNNIELVYGGGSKGSGFIGLSSGYDTFEELLEVTTWHQLGIHDHRVYRVVKEGFIHSEDTATVRVATTAEGVIECLDREAAFSRKGQLDSV
ncbi:hypothetical protein ACKLNR_014619 [Fusarium oxysporum f. sp. zingiberi]